MRFAFCMLLLVSLAGCDVEPTEPMKDWTQSTTSQWYEGGTLHDASVMEWRNATTQNKVATCADFVCAAWKAEALPPKLQQQIKNVEDMKGPAIYLVGEIDASVEPADDAMLDTKIFANQTVRGQAAMILVLWHQQAN